MHETNAEPAGSRPRGWLPAWTKRPDTPSLAFTRPTPAKWILSASRLIGVLSFVAVAGMFVIAAVGFGAGLQVERRRICVIDVNPCHARRTDDRDLVDG